MPQFLGLSNYRIIVVMVVSCVVVYFCNSLQKRPFLHNILPYCLELLSRTDQIWEIGIGKTAEETYVQLWP